MPPFVAVTLWAVLLLALLRFDPSSPRQTSLALWLPVTWLFFIGSRLPSQWLGLASNAVTMQNMEQGDAVDRLFYLTLILLSAGVLFSRSFRWDKFVSRNAALTVFILLALVSACWSDFPFIVVKRWFRDLGSYLVIFVALTDPQPLEAVRTVLRRVSYLLIPLSIVLDKYLPQLSKTYDPWTGVGYYVGATTSKNMLGLACLVAGLFFFWDSVERWPERKQGRTKQILLLNAIFLAMSVWLLRVSESTTSKVCLLLGCLVVLGIAGGLYRRYPRLARIGIPALFCLYIVADFGLGLNGAMAQALGKDPTLHDRTKIWSFLLGMHTNPVLGTGYQSFWLGSRLAYFWGNAKLGHINEAHNGFLELYLELGILGVVSMVAFMGATYRQICRRLDEGSSIAVFGLSLWIVLLFYNMSEAAFEGGLLYMTFLLAAIVPMRRARVPAPSAAGVRAEPVLHGNGPVAALTSFSHEASAQRR